MQNITDVMLKISLNPNKWMELMYNTFPKWGELKITEIILPGTHNSITGHTNANLYLINNENNNSMDDNMLLTAGQCQHMPINEQLNAGVRYFDLRLHIADNKIVFNHGDIIFDVTLQEICTHIKNFLLVNKTELIILTLSRFTFTSTVYDTSINNIVNCITSIIGEYCVNDIDNVLNIPIKDIINSHKNIIIVYDNKTRESNTWLSTNTLPSSKLQSFWRATDANGKLFLAQYWTDIETCYIRPYAKIVNNNYYNSFIKALQLHTQADTNIVVNNFVPFSKTLSDYASANAKHIAIWLFNNNNITTNSVNVIEVDYYNLNIENVFNFLYYFILANTFKFDTSIRNDSSVTNQTVAPTIPVVKSKPNCCVIN